MISHFGDTSLCLTTKRFFLRKIFLLCLALVIVTTNSYPVVIQVEEASTKCMRFNIPEGEDAHIAALILPSEEELEEHSEPVEEFYVDQLFRLCQKRAKHNMLIRTFGINEVPPDEVMQAKSAYLKDHHGIDATQLKIKITGTPASNPNNFQHDFGTRYFAPAVINYAGKTTDAKARSSSVGAGKFYRSVHDHIEGYGLCFDNQDTERMVQVIFDIVLTTDVPEQISGENKLERQLGFDKDRHLTPLELSLDASINSANTILREMKYLEAREHRMRKTAESINVRVRWFSYISVSVLLSVTYIQVTYLKRYFHKKKLM